MSRIGKKVIEIPKGVEVTINDRNINIKGKFGALEKIISNPDVTIHQEDNKLILQRRNETKTTKAYHGLMRALVQNMVLGVNEKFSKNLIAEGVGYKFQLESNLLIVNVGYTHPINFNVPQDITIKVESPTKISISGIDKEKVGFLASQIRATRPPEPYKGKGVMYEGEKIIRKAGKTGK
jgi:large subunit ribosomal protein L6